MSGSRNVFFIQSEQDLFNSYELIKEDIHCYEVEEYIAGEMYHVDGLIHEGKVIFVWPSRYYTNCLNETFENISCSFVISQQHPLLQKLNKFTIDVLESLQRNSNYKLNSSFHLEAFGNGGDITLCEVASRVGGCGNYKNYLKKFNVNFYEEHALLAIDKFKQLNIKQDDEYIYAGLLVPTKDGKLISVEYNCELQGVSNYKCDAKIGEQLKRFDGQGFKIFFISADLTAKTDEEMLNYTRNFEQWIHSTVKFE